MSGLEFEQADSPAEAVRISGRVKWFDAGKGYGFIIPDDPSQTDLKDVLLHVTSLRSCGRETGFQSQRVMHQRDQRIPLAQFLRGFGQNPEGQAIDDDGAILRNAG